MTIGLLLVVRGPRRVRKHRAPKSALRLDSCVWDEAADVLVSESTEHQTVHQDGRMTAQTESLSRVRQKVPSAKRCIKTDAGNTTAQPPYAEVKKHRAP